MDFTPVPPAENPLGRYRLLSAHSGIHVSPLILGAMSIGEAWAGQMGSMDKDGSFKLLDGFYEKGGNFIDTANHYQDNESETWIGEWMQQRRNRDEIVLATKYTTCYKKHDPAIKQKVNYVGNNNKSLHLSVNASLKKLQTDYIDILYVHWWDYATSVKEVIDSLHTLIVQRKVLYLGISDAPAWVVAQANEYALAYGKTPFSIYQGMWNVMRRDLERDILPMARSYGMAIAPWNVLGGGKLRSSAEEKAREQSGEGGRTVTGDWRKSEDEIKMTHALEKVAAEVGEGVDTTAVAIAYVMHKAPYVFPLIGGRKVEHLDNNIKALEIHLTDAQIKYLESILPFDPGFPNIHVGDGTSYGIGFTVTADVQPKPFVHPVGH
ncbi:NADP-dependent oxidoreductase domain-containing protein [Flagelloscypha sp. PMI_526]|nr:NADP-dependent oxidoreductase domain-containing protein [Flagelloscypha sp. PMI_526]